ncbi:8778_t:CDS:2, partial [Gigaspora margarita]
ELSLTQKYSSKKDSKIMSLKAELESIKSKLALKINELEQLGTLRPASQKSDTISRSVISEEISRVEDPCFEKTPKGLQCNKNSTITSNETYSQISIGEVEAIPAIPDIKKKEQIAYTLY